jgi:hypothetical protein
MLWCELSRRSGASLAKRTTRGRFREFVVASAKVFRRAENCFVAGARSLRWPPGIEPFPLLFRNLAKVGNAPSARIGYNLILARPMPPPSIGKASFMRGHCDHRTNCSSTKHKEGL